MNSEFSFSLTGCYANVKEPIMPYYLHIAGRRIIGFIPFLKGRVLALCKQPRLGFELELPCPFFMAVTITTRVSHDVRINSSYTLR